MPLSARLLEHARSRPEREALVVAGERGGSIGYGELARRAVAVSAVLREVSGRRDGLLAVGVGNSPLFAELFAGATAGRGRCAVLDPAWPRAQAEEVLRRLRPDAVAADGAGAIAEAARALGVPVLSAPGGGDGRDPRLEEALGAAPEDELVPGPGEAPFLVGFTSGTSGPPKAFHRTRGSWRASLRHGGEVFGAHADDRTLVPGPLSHGLGLYALTEALYEGACCITLPGFDADAARRALTGHRATRLVVVPTMLRGLADGAPDDAPDRGVFTDVECVVSSGARLDPSTMRRSMSLFPRAHVREYYGASELSFVTVRHTPPGADPAAEPGAVGHPFPGVDVQVRADDGTPLPPGRTGTVFVRGPLASSGYLWGDDGRAFRTDGAWATVGDLGRLSEDGELHLAGRSGGMVITGGHNVYPGEVEEALAGLEGVDEAVVLGLPDGYLGQVLAAVVSGPGAEGLTQARLRADCAALLPRYKVPRRLWAVREWPLTRSGKVSRAVLEDWIAHGDARLVPLPDA
ncbi:class I adenylate-forming enzyme family protein [Nocardiopsis sp. RSe5-2]|uniref:Class I adenylate-forming enzyme family protein n=1 Tax=Nocardiopsis endophytica TaxID=3018445 RepID=A0ABT4U7C2_9ACTN|nr:class I adenylate-forming enzyme family protein [Nocardiopsis endophytica]MDA2812359.1 class I adenylate-forming enzyme family protein [Nocardiopsis endophytica]